MNYFGKLFVVAALVLCCRNTYALEQEPRDTTATTAFPEDAPVLGSNIQPKRYHIRRINIHGVQYLNPDILKSSAGLIEGDSIYLPSSFISDRKSVV